MDYEKKYKKALEKARQICAYPTSKPFISDLQDLFPELAESEDEKIRKAIIEIVKKDEERIGVNAHLKKIQWLEKQGEQKLVKCNMEWYDFVRWFVKERTNNYTLIPSDADIHTWGGIILEHAKKELEKQGKQKPADKVEPKFKIKYAGSEYNVLEVKDIAGVTYYGIEDEPNHIDYVQAENCERVDGYSIKESGSPFPTKPAKFSEQNTAWSEEDEKGLGDALWCCKQAASIAKDENDMGNVWFAENWLKSLKQRYTWKPSEGQMSVIEAVINNRSFQRRHLDSLYQDLKKLREE